MHRAYDLDRYGNTFGIFSRFEGSHKMPGFDQPSAYSSEGNQHMSLK